MSSDGGDDGRWTVLITGGGGYVASHCAVELLSAGFLVVAVDNFVNSVKGVKPLSVYVSEN